MLMARQDDDDDDDDVPGMPLQLRHNETIAEVITFIFRDICQMAKSVT